MPKHGNLRSVYIMYVVGITDIPFSMSVSMHTIQRHSVNINLSNISMIFDNSFIDSLYILHKQDQSSEPAGCHLTLWIDLLIFFVIMQGGHSYILYEVNNRTQVDSASPTDEIFRAKSRPLDLANLDWHSRK